MLVSAMEALPQSDQTQMLVVQAFSVLKAKSGKVEKMRTAEWSWGEEWDKTSNRRDLLPTGKAAPFNLSCSPTAHAYQFSAGTIKPWGLLDFSTAT